MRILVSGGCFWTVQAVFDCLIGVDNTTCGYIWMEAGLPPRSSAQRYPAQRMEVVEFDWDPHILPADDMVAVLLNITSAGVAQWDTIDEFSGMRSLVAGVPLHMLETMQQAVEHNSRIQNCPLHTQIVSTGITFQAANDSEQDFYNTNPSDGFSCGIIAPKLGKIARMHPHLLR